MDLLWSCLATILICTWNAVHPNLPGKGESERAILWRKVKYMAAAVVVPEFIALIAWSELRAVRDLRKRVSQF
jgi:hypothetical protein